ncbi:MAG: hypothetical protein PHE54_01930 [Bacilli bacterium]|nr:hypothetical protein [Bacilli bacterium]
MKISLWIDVLLPILTIAVPVFVTVYTVNMRLKNQNRENHQPYLVLKKIESLSDLDYYSYYLTLIGHNYNCMSDKEKADENKKIIKIAIILQNIGYGVATNIRFYNLLDGKQIDGTQESNKEQNQKLFTTFDIAINSEKSVQTKIISFLDDGLMKEDHNRILCVYKDLNNNIYDLIISINIKNNNHYNFFAYQPSSRSYKKWIKENKKEYKKIIGMYKER